MVKHVFIDIQVQLHMGKAGAESGLMMYSVKVVRMGYHNVYIVDGVCMTVATTRMLLSFVIVSKYFKFELLSLR